MFGGDCLRRRPGPSFVLVLVVTSPEPFLSKSDGGREERWVGGCRGVGGWGYPFGLSVQTQLAGA